MIAKGHYLGAAAALTLAFGFTATAADAAGVFTLQSMTFQDGKMMPKKVSNSKANAPTNPSCVGENVSPQFSWSNVPEGTKSFVLTMFDPEGRAPSGVSHWVAYGIPANVTGFAEGEVSKDSDKYVGGKSTMGGRALFWALHAAQHHAASLYVCSYCHRLRSERTGVRHDA